jgi:hypothetical protein
MRASGRRHAGLRRSYDLLLHKLHSLPRDADPPFARDIDRSRAAIWDLLDAVGREPMGHEPVKVYK